MIFSKIGNLPDKFMSSFSRSVVIDLGTANTVIWTDDNKLINEPSVVAIQEADGESKVLAVGGYAKQMLGRTPKNTRAVRPMKDGVIGDFNIAKAMIKHFIERTDAHKSLIAPRVLIAVPAEATEVERKAIIDAAYSAGARSVFLLDEPMAAAIGAGLPVGAPQGSMVVDIGGGTTEIAVISLGGIVKAASCKFAGDKMDTCIMEYIRDKFQMTIGEYTAERIKILIGAAILPERAEVEEVVNERKIVENLGYSNIDEGFTLEDFESVDLYMRKNTNNYSDFELAKNKMLKIRGFDRAATRPREIELFSSQIICSLRPVFDEIIKAIRNVLEDTNPEVSSDIANSGIMLSGGGALIPYIERLFSEELGLKVYTAQDPLLCVIKGSVHVLNHFHDYKKILNH